MLDTSVIYPFLFAVISVAVIGVAFAAGLLISESRANRRRTQTAAAVDWVSAGTGQNVAWNVNTGHRAPRA